MDEEQGAREGSATGAAWSTPINPSIPESRRGLGGRLGPRRALQRAGSDLMVNFKGKIIPRAYLNCEEQRTTASSLPTGSRKILSFANPAFQQFPPQNAPGQDFSTSHHPQQSLPSWGTALHISLHPHAPSGTCTITQVPIKNTFRV